MPEAVATGQLWPGRALLRRADPEAASLSCITYFPFLQNWSLVWNKSLIGVLIIPWGRQDKESAPPFLTFSLENGIILSK